ncbi:MAG: carboxy terminal-processing peptidase [Pirellulaceae bacterium]|nr:carboxy terminal-processing peptidase [Pirellulaceae bacterium]
MHLYDRLVRCAVLRLATSLLVVAVFGWFPSAPLVAETQTVRRDLAGSDSITDSLIAQDANVDSASRDNLQLNAAQEGGAAGGLDNLPPIKLAGPSAKDRHITRVVTLLVRQQHLLNDPLDDDHARRGLENYLKALDPLKAYFYQSDVDEFRASQDNLDDFLKRGDIRFAYQVFDRFLERVHERINWVEEMLMMDHDFSNDEELITDPDEATYPTSLDEAQDLWRRRIKYDLLQLQADESTDDPMERLNRRYTSFLKRMRQTNSDDLLEMYLTAMTTGFDPHTTFMSASTLENFHINMQLELEGIGAALTINDGYTVVSDVIAGGAADKHGKLIPEEKLEAEDRIVSVGQDREGEMVDVIDMKLGDVVQMIRGPAGTVVRLGVQASGRGETKTYTITRAKIELKDKEARSIIFEDGNKPDGSPYRLGTIVLPSFYMDMKKTRDRLTYKSTTRDVRRILEQFRQEKVDAVILDLRRNGGGSLTEAIGLTGLFIDRGPVVQVKDSVGNVQHYDDLDFGMAWDGPLVVLTSKFSASASEIFAGAIQDYQRGLIVGDSATHGKGTVQSLLELGPKMFPVPNPQNCGALKITMQQFYRPNGDSTQKRGVLADVVLPRISDHFDIAESDLDYALEFDRVPAAKFDQYKMVNDQMIEQIRTASVNRQNVSEDFKKANTRIERYLAQKAQPSVPLNEEKFMARIEEFEDEDKEEKEEKEATSQSKDELPVDRDYYFEEVIDITVDYILGLDTHRVARR